MSRALGNAVLSAYGLAGRALTPLLPYALSRRAERGKEDKTRLNERFGHASRPRPEGRLVWVHAASVGETNAVMPLVRLLVEAGTAVLFTSVTDTSAGIAATRLPEGAFHQFAPLDVASAIDRFLGHWKPDFAIFVESEIWPTTVRALDAEKIPLVLVNARLSERSAKGWQRFGSVAEAVFGRFSLCLAQSEADGERYRKLGARNVKVTGNLKFDTPAPKADAAAMAALRDMVAGRTLWLAASTHAGEESAVAEVHKMLTQRVPQLLTVIVPRHPERGGAIAAEVEALGLRMALRSRDEAAYPVTDIYIADTLGELGLFYRAAPVAFLGGSLVPHGGQNPIEPLKLGCAVLHGPHVHNFADIYAAMDAAAPDGAIGDMTTLADRLAVLLNDNEAAKTQAKIAGDALTPFSGALMETMAALDPYLRERRPE